MKTETTTQPLLAALSKRAGLETEIQDLNQRAANSATRLTALESSCDLDDDKALAEITRLQVMTALFPRRLAVREQEFRQSGEELLDADNNFISTVISPKVGDLLRQARSKARAAMKDQFNDETSLSNAVERSSFVVELSYICPSHDAAPGGGPAAFAQRLLETWERIKLLENKLA